MSAYITAPIGLTTEFELFYPIFNTGTKLPCTSSKLFIAPANEEDQYLSVKIHQGNNYNSSYNTLLDNINIKKNIHCHRGQPQLSIELKVDKNSVITVIVSDLLKKTTYKHSIEIKSSPTLQPVMPQLENLEHIDIVKKMSYAKRLIRTNKNIIRSIRTKNNLIRNIIDSINCTTHQIEHILNRYSSYSQQLYFELTTIERNKDGVMVRPETPELSQSNSFIQQADIEGLEHLLEKLSELSWRLNVSSFTNQPR